MKISCPNCSAAYELDDGRVPPAGLSIKCPKCKTPFTVHRPKAGEAQKPAAAPAVPLPGQPGAGAKPPPAAAKPGSKPAAKPAAAKRPGGAVPLPGTGNEPPALGELPGAVPLPGLDAPPASAPPPRAQQQQQTGAVPLPGQAGDMEQTAVDFRPPQGAPPPRGAVPLPGLGDDGLPPPTPPPAPGGDPFEAIDMGEPAPKPPPQDLDLSFPVSAPPPQQQAAPPSMDDVFSVDIPEPPPAPPPPPKKAAPPPPDDLGFDFVAPPKKESAASSGGDMLDFVDEKPPERPSSAEKKRPPPPTIAPSADKDETLSLDTGAPAEEAPAEAADPKEAEKQRKKAEREARKLKDREERARRKAERGPGALTRLGPALRDALREPKFVAAAAFCVVVLVVVVLGVRAKRTPAGLFWMNKIIPAKREASAAETKVIDAGMQKLQQGDFAGAREALTAAAQLIKVLPDDEEVKAFFILSASELKVLYGQVGGDWDQAKRLAEKMKNQKPAQNRARGALAMADGDYPKAKTLLAPLGDAPNADVESTFLYAQALLLAGEGPHAQQVLDNALKTRAPGSAKLLLLRGNVSRARANLPEAATFYEKALEKAPQNGRAIVELADVKVKQGDMAKASELLAKALDTDVRKSLDATEEARANMLRGRIFAAAHQPKEAEAAFERAVTLDANSAEIREAYGEFRLARREWEKAARQFDAAIGAGNATPAVLVGAARAYLGTNRLIDADKRINEAAAKDASPHVIYIQGRVAEAIGKQEEALKAYEKALSKQPDSVEALCASGLIYLARGDKQKAKDRLDAANKVPDEKRTLLEEEAIGELALALGDLSGGKDAYERALKKDSDDPLAHAGYGKALAAMGKLPEARKEMETALAQVDNDASLQYEYGSLLRRLGEPDAALNALQKAVKLDSKDSRIRARLGAVLVEQKQYDEAEKQLRQAVLMNDKYGEGLFFLARALAGRRNLTEAVDVMKKAVELEPDNAEYLYWLGLIYEQGQQVQDAIDALQRSLDKNGKSADSWEHLGLNLVVENRFPEAVTAFKKAAELDPKRARIWAEVGDAEQQAGDTAGAVRDFQKALAMDSNLTGVWSKLGIAYKDLDCKGCRAKALDALKRATHIDPTDATAHHELGYMYKDDGKRREAIAEFKRYLELRPDAGDTPTVQDDIYYLQEESRRAP